MAGSIDTTDADVEPLFEAVPNVAFVAEDLYSRTPPAPSVEFVDEYGWLGA